MKKFLTLTLLGLILSAASYAQAPISGVLGCCTGGASVLSDSSSVSGTWSSSNVAVATVTASGIVYGVSPGTSTITFSSGGSPVTATFTVSALPSPITGTGTLCAGAGGSTTMADATAGGTWSTSGSPLSISATGVVTASYAGTAYIYYTISTGCRVTAMDTAITTATGYISGDTSVCTGFSVTLTDAVAGGTWSSSNASVATVNAASGVVTGVSAGAAIISYAVSGTCGLATTTRDFVVNSTTSAGTIGGTLSTSIGSTSGLSESVGSGTWSSSNTSVATVNAATGAVTGISYGTATITYSVTGCSGAATATATFSVYGSISGSVNFSGTPYVGFVRVWLITYNPATSDLEASDSVTVHSSDTSAYYEFDNKPTDSFRMKAATIDSTGVLISGYVPTYHTSSAYWHDATVLYHLTSANDINQNINMIAGTATTGPGFIGGNVTTGANKGTSDGVPVVGLLVYAVSSTGAILQYTYTDATGHYSFSSLPVGVYTIYPEAINYSTTAYTGINITSAASSMPAASFIQHTISKTITPIVEGVNNVQSYVSSVIAFPNPASGKLNIQWQESATETGNVTITDITGREIYKTTIHMNAGTGVSQLDLSGLTNGIYMISIKSGTINYNSKIQVQH